MEADNSLSQSARKNAFHTLQDNADSVSETNSAIANFSNIIKCDI